MKKKYTYISLFSSAGIGCYGFKMEDFDCVASNELLVSRLDIQKYNDKCKYSSGYIPGDITKKETKEKLYQEIDFWKTNENLNDIDVVIATPPCQGMSVANYKKNNETARNSLVVEAIEIIEKINPNIFIFENVSNFSPFFVISPSLTKKTTKLELFSFLSISFFNVFSVISLAKFIEVPFA